MYRHLCYTITTRGQGKRSTREEPIMQCRSNAQRYAVDVLDAETIVMDTIDGRLFLLEDAASLLWSPLANGVPLPKLLEAVDARYGTERRDEVRAFVEHLVEQGLLEAASQPSTAPSAEDAIDWPESLGALRVTAYDDMSEIITMDPIHDVDPARGWPFEEPR